LQKQFQEDLLHIVLVFVIHTLFFIINLNSH